MVTINILEMVQNFHFSDTAGPTLAGWITDALGFPWTMAICGATSASMVNYKLSFTSHYGNKQQKCFAPILLLTFSFILMYLFQVLILLVLWFLENCSIFTRKYPDGVDSRKSEKTSLVEK